MALLTRDHVEIQKTIMELPKTAIIMVSFFATAAALVLRSGSTGSADPGILLEVFSSFFPQREDEVIAYVRFAARVLYAGAIAISVGFVYECYHFMTSIVSNVTSEILEDVKSDSNDTARPLADVIDQASLAQIRNLLGPRYISLKRSINEGVTMWAVLLSIFVIFL
jgi:hypothetical protein